MVTAIGAVVHATRQRNELVRFYREKLGLGDPDHTRGQQFFRLGDVRLGVEGGENGPRGPLPRTGLCFVVDDLEAQVGHMKSLGVSFDVEPQDFGGARLAVCRDPDGNFVTLMAGPRLTSRVAPARPPRSGRKSKAGKAKKKKR